MAIDEVLVVLENPLRNDFAMPQLADFETSWEPWQVLVCDDYVWNTDVDYMPMPRQFYLPRAPSDFCYLYVSMHSGGMLAVTGSGQQVAVSGRGVE